MSAAAAAAAPGPDLRDIHLPPEPSWWPPAPGWWMLAALLLVSIFFLVRWLLRRRRERRWRQRVHAELERIAATHTAQPDPVRLAVDISRLLRRASLLVEPQAAALRDDAWLKFLDAQLPGVHATQAPFHSGAGRALIDAPYRRGSDPSTQAYDAHALLELARCWLGAVLPGRRSPGSAARGLSFRNRAIFRSSHHRQPPMVAPSSAAQARDGGGRPLASGGLPDGDRV